MRQSFLDNRYRPFYLLLLFALIFLYSNFFTQVQAKEKALQNFSLKATGISLIFWLLLSPIFFFRFYHLLLVWQPLPAELLSFLFFYRRKILPVLILFYLAILYLLYRTILMPSYLKQGYGLKASMQFSWANTKKGIVEQFILFLLIPIAFFVISLLIKNSFIWSTQLLSSSNTAMLLLLLHRVSQNILRALFFLYLTVSPMSASTDSQTKASKIWLSLTVIACLSLYFLHYTQINQMQRATTPLTISHRGVSNRNGVQNSIEALKKTNKSMRPDLIEMDVQETADHQLVVIHDEDLKTLAHKNLRIDETAWKELKELSLKENGYVSKISLFSDYLTTANQLNQPLLIELKVTAKTKATIIHQLLPLKKELAGHQLQSMELDTANQMKKLFPTLSVGYILPFDLLGVPKTSLDFVNIESKTATGDLIQYVHQQKQKVYVWSINSKQQATVFRFQQVSGLLSDDLTVLSEDSNDIKSQTASILQFY
ncbi:glycerophosphodiester phosphodiesterase family protein [Enterococcus pingfangensis]|uniref:glycerophosphodiester phosphodiesterase family protein n=1 Tax=Enterococcus pingfangensis TaxID=2559924 RepID=UPI001FE718AD|nr:glycerophosphodiester phosphodiesterase family protein [Enterococcus pingfangensis]